MERVCSKEDRLGEAMTTDSRFFTFVSLLRSIDTNSSSSSSSSSSGCRGGAGVLAVVLEALATALWYSGTNSAPSTTRNLLTDAVSSSG